MAKRFAVGFYSLFNNELKIEIISASSWNEALKLHSEMKEYDFSTENLDEAKVDLFNCDAGVDVVEIPPEKETTNG